MKLLTHNLLQSPGTRHGYPLAIEAEKVEKSSSSQYVNVYSYLVTRLLYTSSSWRFYDLPGGLARR